MNRCPNCAAQNREGAKFCTSCGFRLPVTSAPPMTSERSPFATTSTVPPHGDQVSEESQSPESTEESGFATWNTATPPDSEGEAETESPGLSWDAPPPQNTALPVNEDMIASLIGESEPGSRFEEPEPTPAPLASEHSTWEQATMPPNRTGESNTSIDQLLKLARELEYGLIELAEAPVSATTGAPHGDTRLLANALADLQDEQDLAPLRTAVASAQERPRDVDVMLDLVLRADAIAQLMTERDQLKSAIELSLRDAPEQPIADPEEPSGEPEEPVAELPAEASESSEDDSSTNDDESQTI